MSGPAYYNEIDAFPVQWLRNLSVAGHIPFGFVDQRSIRDVQPDDVRNYYQCHFFAGIGGWPRALRLAGIPDDFSVWTGSCPCQPFSVAGKQRGFADDRHLWPEWFRLIRECRPAIIFGEQVGGPAGLAWLDAVFADLEGIGYACGAANLPAASVGAPHIRQRLFFVAHAGRTSGRPEQQHKQGQGLWRKPGPGSCAGTGERGEIDRMADVRESGLEVERVESSRSECAATERSCATRSSVAYADGRSDDEGEPRANQRGLSPEDGRNPWRVVEWLPCSDGKSRPTKPGLEPLVNGVPGRVGRLRGYGNAIVPQVAAEFIRAAMEVLPC